MIINSTGHVLLLFIYCKICIQHNIIILFYSQKYLPCTLGCETEIMSLYQNGIANFLFLLVCLSLFGIKKISKKLNPELPLFEIVNFGHFLQRNSVSIFLKSENGN